MTDLLSEYLGYIKIGGAIACTVLTAAFVKKLISRRKAARLRAEWDSVGKDIILHQINRCYDAPNLSPFPMKVETYLRMADIKYVNDFESPMGPKGKSPWITINGQDLSDSQLALEYLAKKFEKDFSIHLLEEEKAIARAFRVMLEERVYWGMALDRWVYQEGKHLANLPFFESLPDPLVNFIIKSYGRNFKKAAFYQGMGRHSQQEVEEMINKDLQAISVYLGNKPFFMGPEPCEADCSMFGFLSQFIYAMPGCVYTDTVTKEYQNLIDYHERMKARFWPDWEDCLHKKGP